MNKKIMPLEIVFSIVIIVITISIITLICLQIKYEKEIINKNSEASLIVSNILENMNTRSYENIEKYIDDFSGIGVSKELDERLQNIVIYGDEFTEKFFGTEIPKGYTVNLSIENNLDFDILKDINIEISYIAGKKSRSLEISTVIEREKIRECNTPVLTDEYFQDVNIDSTNYSIIPIKYSDNTMSFISTTRNDPDWYNYSAKKWAKVLVLPKDKEIQKQVIDEHDKISEEIEIDGEKKNIENYIYVWIPNFSKKNDVSYFRYGTGKKAIRMSFLYLENKYLYLNRVSEEVKDISPECSFDGIYGVWRKLDDVEDEYYSNFNQTRFAPINLY